MKLKKLLSLILALTMLASFAACGAKPEEPAAPAEDAETEVKEEPKEEPAEEPAAEVEEITMMIQAADVTAGMTAAVDYINTKSDELGAKLVLEKIPDGEQGEQVMLVRYAGGEDVPDLLWFQPLSYTATRVDVPNNFVDLTDNDYSNIYSDDYLRTPGYLLDGKLYSMPIATGGGTFMIYNREVLANAGVTETPSNWEEFLAACEAVKASGVTPVYYSGADAWTLQFFGLCGWYNDYAPEEALDFAKAMETNQKHWADMDGFIDSLNKTKELVDLGYVQETYLSDTFQQAQQALVDGTTCFYPMGDFVLGELNKIDPEKVEKNIGVFMMPLAEGQALGIGPQKGCYVSKAGKNPELAQKVMEMLVSPEVQQVFFDAQGGIPMAKGVTTELTGAFADIKAILDTVTVSPQWTDYCKYHAGFDVYAAEMLVGEKTAEDVAAALDGDFAKAAIDAGDPNWN